MLSQERCKTILGRNDLRDCEIEEIRDQLYKLASLLVDKYLSSKDVKMHSGLVKNKNGKMK